MFEIQGKVYYSLTLTRPIGLPPHAPVALKVAVWIQSSRTFARVTPLQNVSQSSLFSNLFKFPPQPPQVNSRHSLSKVTKSQ